MEGVEREIFGQIFRHNFESIERGVLEVALILQNINPFSQSKRVRIAAAQCLDLLSNATLLPPHHEQHTEINQHAGDVSSDHRAQTSHPESIDKLLPVPNAILSREQICLR